MSAVAAPVQPESSYKAFSHINSYIDTIGSGKKDLLQVAAIASCIVFPIFAFLALLADLVAAILHCLFGDDKVVVNPTPPAATQTAIQTAASTVLPIPPATEIGAQSAPPAEKQVIVRIPDNVVPTDNPVPIFIDLGVAPPIPVGTTLREGITIDAYAKTLGRSTSPRYYVIVDGREVFVPTAKVQLNQ
jgi:hypothetical protein